MSDRLAPARDFLSWWSEQLAALLPERARRWIEGGRPHVLIRLSSARTEVERSEGGASVLHVDDRPLAALDEQAWADLAGLTIDARTSVVLASEDVHILPMRLPLAALGRADSSIGFQLAREAPVDPQALVWTHQIGPCTRSHADILVAIARKTQIAAVRAQFEAHQLAAPHIAADVEGTSLLLARGDRAEPTSAHRRDRRAAILTFALIASIPLTSLGLLSWKAAAAEDRMAFLADEAGSRARATARANAAVDAARALQPLARTQLLSARIEAISKMLPADAALVGISVSHESGSLVTILTSRPEGAWPGEIIDQIPHGDGRTQVIVRLAR